MRSRSFIRLSSSSYSWTDSQNVVNNKCRVASEYICNSITVSYCITESSCCCKIQQPFFALWVMRNCESSIQGRTQRQESLSEGRHTCHKSESFLIRWTNSRQLSPTMHQTRCWGSKVKWRWPEERFRKTIFRAYMLFVHTMMVLLNLMEWFISKFYRTEILLIQMNAVFYRTLCLEYPSKRKWRTETCYRSFPELLSRLSSVQ